MTREAAHACAGFFFLLCSWSVLRPVRDELAISRGLADLPWMFTATFVAVLAAAPAFAALSSRVARSRVIPLTYRSFAAGLLFAWMGLRTHTAWAPGALFVWASVYNLLSVSLFWALLADVFNRPQAARLFGPISAGATAGTLVGPLIVEWLARPLGPVNLLPLSAVLLELSVQSAQALQERAGDRELPLRGSVRSGLAAVLRSPQLLGLCAYVALQTGTATLLYLELARMVAAATPDERGRAVLFARMDLAINTGTLLLQSLVVGRLLERRRVGGTLALLPLLTAAGFAAIAAAPSLALMAVVQALRRAVHFGLERPARELLFTSLAPEEKYKSKAFIDTAVYRGGDALAAWLSQALVPAVLLPAALALCGLWLLNSLLLARRDAAGGVRC